MSARSTALVAAVAAIALTLAQDVRPGLDFYHTWQYAAILALAMVVVANYAWGARNGADGVAGQRMALGMAGALVVAGGGLASGLIGPDTTTVTGSPGSVTPIPDLGVAAFFGQADPATITHGDAPVLLREKGVPPVDVTPGSHLYLGTSVVSLGSRPAAYIVARDAHGNRVTVTQPNNATFLSPVLLFPTLQPLRDKSYPLDTFATPALHLIARAIYFGADDAQTFNHLGAHQAALVISVNDDGGKTIGLTIAPSGHEVTLGPLHVTATIGTYPQLSVASAPHPLLLLAGMLLFIGGLGASFVRPPASREAITAPPSAEREPAANAS